MTAVYWLSRSGMAVVGRTPPQVRHRIASTVSSAAYAGWSSKRRITQANLAQVLGLPTGNPRVKRAALATWRNYGRTAASLVCLPFTDMDDVETRIVDVTEGTTWLDSAQVAMKPGHGLIIATAHFGSWDMAGAIAARHLPLSAIVDSFADPALDQLLQTHRRDKGVGIIPIAQAPRRSIEELRQGRALAIVVDRPSPQHGVAVTFFGHRAQVPAGCAALAVKTGAAILPGYVWYADDGRYFLRTFPPVFPDATGCRADRFAEIQRLTQYVFSCQEEVVRDCPTQWFMFRPFWPGEPSSAAGRRTNSTRTARRTGPD
jgi:phosphatidylinositol dimannoside acyltransferase